MINDKTLFSVMYVCMYVCIYLRSLKLTAFINEKWLFLTIKK